MFRLVPYACMMFILCSSCSTKEQGLDKALIKGTWKGTASYKQISEVKTYSPMMDDSLTTLVDTMILIPDVGIDIAKTELRFWNIEPFSSSVFLYEWDKKRLNFENKEKNKRVFDSRRSIAMDDFEYAQPPYAVLNKLDNDSLVLQLAIYKDGWNEYLLKLKRK